MVLTVGKISDIVDFGRPSGASFFDKNGILRWAANDEWRRNHDPVTHEPLGLLLEEQRTNLLTYSADASASAWTKVRCSIVPDAAAAPDGTLAMDKLVEDATSTSTHAITQAKAIAAGATVTGSAFVKAAEKTFAHVMVRNSAAPYYGYRIPVNLVDGTTGDLISSPGLSGGSYRVVSCGNGIWRISVSGALTDASSAEMIVYLATGLNPGANVYSGDGVSGLYVWGLQTEVGAFPTSYIPTTSAAATRAPDLPVIPASDWLADGVGTLLVEFVTPVAGAGATLACITQGATGYGTRLQWGYGASMAVLYFVNVPPSPLSPDSLPVPNTPGVVRYATAWDDTLMSAAQNGGAVIQMVPTNPIPRDLLYLRLGTTGGTFLLNSHIKRIMYLPRRLTNAELVSLTS